MSSLHGQKRPFNISDKTAAVLEANEISGRALLCLTPKQIMEIPKLAPGIYTRQRAQISA